MRFHTKSNAPRMDVSCRTDTSRSARRVRRRNARCSTRPRCAPRAPRSTASARRRAAAEAGPGGRPRHRGSVPGVGRGVTEGQFEGGWGGVEPGGRPHHRGSVPGTEKDGVGGGGQGSRAVAGGGICQLATQCIFTHTATGCSLCSFCLFSLCPRLSGSAESSPSFGWISTPILARL